ncbi:MAG: nicotinate (nicotinamide) nucleotide adenylyltransferase [Oscillospiraceae bacterium]|nr:nicotinate (nicotinamide) nucleotide adenylyltransferase [Oscillospiraceae bacterium]
MKIGIFGGTFDPPHLGHMDAAAAAVEQLELDKLLFMPAGIPPHKETAGGAAPEQRLHMVELMADGMAMPDIVEVSSMEIRREGKSYTVDTLRQLRLEYPDDELWLLMGTDMFMTLPDWREPDEIMKMACIGAFDRTESEHGTPMEDQAELLRQKFGARVRLIPLPQVREISSSRIREQGTGEGLWPPVWGYILGRHLYGVEKPLTDLDLPDLRAVSDSMIKARRIPHVHGTAEEAVRLARRWGAEEIPAERAGILHDCTKYFSVAEHKKVCEKFHFTLDKYELENEKLLHAKTGALLAKNVFGEKEDVVQAIMWHTTGRADMRPLEKILYLADYIEPSRDFPGVERIRSLAYEDLDAALLMGAEMSIEDAEKGGRALHPDTEHMRDFLLRGIEEKK